jgi:hypothetical protein
MAAIALALLDLPGATGVAWGAAQTLMSAEHFRRIIPSWLTGGAFLALGLRPCRAMPSGPFVVRAKFFTGPNYVSIHFWQNSPAWLARSPFDLSTVWWVGGRWSNLSKLKGRKGIFSGVSRGKWKIIKGMSKTLIVMSLNRRLWL